MAWVQLVTLLAVIQYFGFSGLVAQARGRYGVKAPAITGHEMFERYYRVQMNTLEVLPLFLSSLWLAAQYWSPKWVAALGAVYLVGRMVYLLGYVADPAKRSTGYGISVVPTLILFAGALWGVVKSLIA